MAQEMLDPLAFRFPARHPGCDCAICTRLGWSDSSRAMREDVPSVFAQYKLVRQQPAIAAAATATSTPSGSKRIPLYDYEMTEADYAAFAAAHPDSTLYALPPSSSAQPWLQSALKVTRSLSKLKAAAPFLLPVDPVALNIPDYPAIIRHPMDLQTVESRLSGGGVYQSPLEWESDMRQIFCNAQLYNKPEHFVALAAKDCSIKFEGMLLQI